MSRSSRNAAIDLAIRLSQELPVPTTGRHTLPWTWLGERDDRERVIEPGKGRHRSERRLARRRG